MTIAARVAAFEAAYEDGGIEAAVSVAHGFTDAEMDSPEAMRVEPRIWQLIARLRMDAERSDLRIARQMREALFVRGTGIDLLNPYEDMTAPPPVWPSTVGEVDFRGLVVIAGNAKLGKSSLCIASALEAALVGWFVIYANAELDGPTFRSYIRRWLPEKDVRDAALANFRAFMVNPGVTAEALVESAAGCIDQGVERVLFVLDSINTVAHLSSGNYLRELERLTLWAMQARKSTNGAVSALVVSEKNKLGSPVGQKLMYAADVILNMSRGKTDGYVGFDLTSRYQRSGDLGSMLFEWQSGRFLGERALPEASADARF
jgi:KaiC/GvpD/RAD55 family RecA-like ATPase